MVKISNLINGAIEQYAVSSTNTRIGLAQFSEDLDVLHDMMLTDKALLSQKLASLSFTKGSRNIPKVLKDIASNIFVKLPRLGAKLKIFMFVAGPTDDLDKSQVNAVASELKKSNIEVQFVYIGDHSSKSLLPFVKSESDIMHIASPNEIPFALDPILKMKGLKQGRNAVFLRKYIVLTIYLLFVCKFQIYYQFYIRNKLIPYFFFTSVYHSCKARVLYLLIILRKLS